MLDGKIVLCSHSDETFSKNGEAMTGNGSRNYNGGMSQLSIFDTFLSQAHIWALYNQVCAGQWWSNDWYLFCVALCVCTWCVTDCCINSRPAVTYRSNLMHRPSQQPLAGKCSGIGAVVSYISLSAGCQLHPVESKTDAQGQNCCMHLSKGRNTHSC